MTFCLLTFAFTLRFSNYSAHLIRFSSLSSLYFIVNILHFSNKTVFLETKKKHLHYWRPVRNDFVHKKYQLINRLINNSVYNVPTYIVNYYIRINACHEG